MFKKEWEEPKVEVLNFTVCDVIATSGPEVSESKAEGFTDSGESF